MKSFAHVNARTVEEACALLGKYPGKAVLHAGGTDLLATLKAENRFSYPEVVINLKTVPGLDAIVKDGGGLKIGACARLSDIAASPLVMDGFELLAEAARSVATPQVRNMATIGGNLCQDIRCWYYRYPRHIGGPIPCARKGSGLCLAVRGDNRNHAIMQGRKCFAVCPSDTAVALAALDARLTLAGPKGERTTAVADFFGSIGTTLAKDELVKSVEIPRSPASSNQTFVKFTVRKPVDFAVVSVATVLFSAGRLCTDARIVLGAVAPGPHRAKKAEDVLKGQLIDEDLATQAAETALAGARPLSMNAYKIEIAKTLVKRAILGAG